MKHQEDEDSSRLSVQVRGQDKHTLCAGLDSLERPFSCECFLSGCLLHEQPHRLAFFCVSCPLFLTTRHQIEPALMSSIAVQLKDILALHYCITAWIDFMFPCGEQPCRSVSNKILPISKCNLNFTKSVNNVVKTTTKTPSGTIFPLHFNIKMPVLTKPLRSNPQVSPTMGAFVD